MKSKDRSSAQSSFLMPSLAEQCDPRQKLVKLAKAIPWQTFEEAFADRYSETGRPAKPIRLMVGLLLLKHLEDLSDEVVVERWVQNPYYQLFRDMDQFQLDVPCDPSDLVHFRNRIGDEGATLILAATAQMHGKCYALFSRHILARIGLVGFPGVFPRSDRVLWPNNHARGKRFARHCGAV